MSVENIPKHGKPDRLYTLCSLLTDSPQDFSKIAETLGNSKNTVRRDVRLGLALGLLNQTEDGVIITESGDALGKKQKDSIEYHQAFRRSIPQYSPYRKLTTEIFPSAEGSVHRESVMKRLSLTLGLDLSEDNMKHVASTYLRTISASGVGPYKQSSKQNPARVVIDDEDALEELLGLVGPDSDVEKEESQESPEQSREEQAAESGNESVDDIETTTREARPTINFDISLNLNGEEDPEVVEDLVRGIRRGLGVHETGSESTSEKEIDSNHKSTEIEVSNGDMPLEENTEEHESTEDGSPDSSLGDFE